MKNWTNREKSDLALRRGGNEYEILIRTFKTHKKGNFLT